MPVLATYRNFRFRKNGVVRNVGRKPTTPQRCMLRAMISRFRSAPRAQHTLDRKRGFLPIHAAAVRQRSCFMISVPAYALFIGVGMPAFLQFFLSAHSGKGREAVRQRYYTLRYLAPHSSLMGPASPRTAPLPRLPAAAHALNKKQYLPPPDPIIACSLCGKGRRGKARIICSAGDATITT